MEKRSGIGGALAGGVAGGFLGMNPFTAIAGAYKGHKMQQRRAGQKAGLAERAAGAMTNPVGYLGGKILSAPAKIGGGVLQRAARDDPSTMGKVMRGAGKWTSFTGDFVRPGDPFGTVEGFRRPAPAPLPLKTAAAKALLKPKWWRRVTDPGAYKAEKSLADARKRMQAKVKTSAYMEDAMDMEKIGMAMIGINRIAVHAAGIEKEAVNWERVSAGLGEEETMAKELERLHAKSIPAQKAKTLHMLEGVAEGPGAKAKAVQAQAVETAKRQRELAGRAEALKSAPKAPAMDVAAQGQRAVSGAKGAPAQKVLMTKGQTTQAQIQVGQQEARAAKATRQAAAQQKALTAAGKKTPGKVLPFLGKHRGKLMALPLLAGAATAGAIGAKKLYEKRKAAGFYG